MNFILLGCGPYKPGLDSGPMTPVVLTPTLLPTTAAWNLSAPYPLVWTSWYEPHLSFLYPKTLCLTYPGVRLLMVSPLPCTPSCVAPNPNMCWAHFNNIRLYLISQSSCSYKCICMLSLLFWSFFQSSGSYSKNSSHVPSILLDT